jgi:CoA:oxalate CoA-transferase
MTIRRPLEGMLVLDLGQIYNGPYCGLMLGFMGARVLKIEPPEGESCAGASARSSRGRWSC